MIALSIACIVFISENIHNYKQWTVITDNRNENVDLLTFPALNLCFTTNWTKSYLRPFFEEALSLSQKSIEPYLIFFLNEIVQNDRKSNFEGKKSINAWSSRSRSVLIKIRERFE